MKKLILTLLLVGSFAALGVAAIAAPAAAQASTTGGVPDIIIEGFRSFLSGGYGAATNTWTKNSPLAIDGASIAGVNNVFLAESNLGGSFVGAEVIRIVNFAPSAEEGYVMAKYQCGVLFMSFTGYKK
mgnify:CR=1 FL=1